MSSTYDVGRLARTVRHLKPIQIANRAWRRVVRPRPNLAPAPSLRPPAAPWREPILGARHWDGETTFTFLNQSRAMASWAAPPQGCDALWLYNLHYFDDLISDGWEGRVDQHRGIIHAWIEATPPGVATAWDPYVLSKRIVNWIKWGLCSGGLEAPMLESLAQQVRWLSADLEYHLLGNHLFENAKALLFAGAFFVGPEAERWRRVGLAILIRQLPEQILGDGGHFELSPMYHALICESVLDLVNLARTFGYDEDGERFRDVAALMLGWIGVTTRPDGRMPLFNDAAYDVAPTAEGLFAYAERLGFERPTPPPGLTWLAASGYACFRGDVLWAMLDYGEVGPTYLPGHAHCDMFSFELCLAGLPVIVDTGTSTYEQGPIRLSQKGTAAHNTVQIGDAEQSEIWASFRIGRRSRMRDRIVSTDAIAANHTGFRPLGALHHRAVTFRPREVIIEDTVQGDPNLPAVARLHFHPDERPTPATHNGTPSLTLRSGEITFVGALDVALKPYDYAPEFNRTYASNVAEITFERALTTTISYRENPR